MKVDQAKRLKELEKEEHGRLKRLLADAERWTRRSCTGGRHGKILSPARRRGEAVESASWARLGPDRISQRPGLQGPWGSAARRSGNARPPMPDDEPRLTSRMVELASGGMAGTATGGVTALAAEAEGFRVNHKRVERIWRQAGLKVPQKQPKRGRLWLNDELVRPAAP